MPANDCVPFFPSDYRGDPNVETLSYAGKGLWAEMFILMMMTGGILTYGNRQVREDDFALIAKATRGEARDVRRIMPELKASGVYSVTDDGVVFSRKLVEMSAKRAKKSAAGAEGGRATAQANAKARAQAESFKQTSSTAAQSHTIPYQDHHSPSARDDAGARTRETLVDTPAYKFCLWLLREGIERGAIPGHHGQDEYAWCYRHLDDAITLVENYGTDEARIRGERLIAAKVKRTVRRDVTPRTLLDSWDWDDIRGVHSLPRNGEAAPAVEDGVISAWRAREQRDA